MPEETNKHYGARVFQTPGYEQDIGKASDIPEALKAAGKGVKRSMGKPDLSLVPNEFTLLIADNMTNAVNSGKYEKHNWLKGIPYSALVAATRRHLDAFEMGEHHSEDDGVMHLVAAGTCLAFLTTYEVRQSYGELDDRKDAAVNQSLTLDEVLAKFGSRATRERMASTS